MRSASASEVEATVDRGLERDRPRAADEQLLVHAGAELAVQAGHVVLERPVRPSLRPHGIANPPDAVYQPAMLHPRHPR